MMGRLLKSKRMLALVGGTAALPVLFAASPASATFSVVGTDNVAVTKPVGGALSSCLASLDTASNAQSQIYFAAPGKGVVHGQSLYYDNQGKDMATRLGKNEAPNSIINALVDQNITHPNIHGDLYETQTPHTLNAGGAQLLQRRQYLVASMSNSFGFTGNSEETLGTPPNVIEIGTPKARIDKRAADPTGRWHAQVGGNTLTSKAVVNRMKSAWTASSPDVVTVLKRLLGTNNINANVRKGDLAERLFLTLAAGDAPGEGDRRCTSTHRSANLGWIRVDNKDGTTPINLRYSNKNGNALTALAYMYYGCRIGATSCTAVSTAGPANPPSAQ